MKRNRQRIWGKNGCPPIRSILQSGVGMRSPARPEELNGPLGSFPGILNIPIGKLSARLSELEPHKDEEIVVVCRSGGRAYTAAQILGMAGSSKVTVLEGGMLGWNAMV